MRDTERDSEERKNYLWLLLVTTKRLTKLFKEDSSCLGSQLQSFMEALKQR